MAVAQGGKTSGDNVFSAAQAVYKSLVQNSFTPGVQTSADERVLRTPTLKAFEDISRRAGQRHAAATVDDCMRRASSGEAAALSAENEEEALRQAATAYEAGLVQLNAARALAQPVRASPAGAHFASAQPAVPAFVAQPWSSAAPFDAANARASSGPQHCVGILPSAHSLPFAAFHGARACQHAPPPSFPEGHIVDPLVAAAKSQGESFVNALNKDDARVLAKALKTHRVDVFIAAQLVRCLRIVDLLAFLKAVNNDLTSNVRLLAVSKFSLILFFVPHWVACAWLLVADGWHIWDSKEVQLPSWPAQFELVTGNPLLDANEITLAQRYLFALFMSYAGLCGLGYSDLTLTREIEIILATVVTLLHTIFYAYVLGTLFHYLVRTDENTVNFKALLKACDGFATERKLPPALAAKPRASPIPTIVASAQQREAEAAAAANAAEKRVRTAVQRTAVVFHQLLAVFDFDAASSGAFAGNEKRPAREDTPAQVRLSDVRRLRLQLGESGSQQIAALYEHLHHAAIALGAPLADREGEGAERQAERRTWHTRARKDKHASGARSTSERSRPSANAESSDEREACQAVGGVAATATADAEDAPPLFETTTGTCEGTLAVSMSQRLVGSLAAISTRALDASSGHLANRRSRRGRHSAGSLNTSEKPASAPRPRSADVSRDLAVTSRTPSIEPSVEASSPMGNPHAHRSCSLSTSASPTVGRSQQPHAPPAVASPAMPAQHARVALGGGEDAARLARRAKRALLSEAHFFPAVAAWILSTTADAEEEEASAAAHSAAGAAQGSPAMPALNLHLKNPPGTHNGLSKDGVVEPSPAADEATGASAPDGARLLTTERVASLLEALDASLWSAEALTGIADRLAVRLDSGRLLRGEAVRAGALLAIIAQAVVVPPDATAHMLADVFASRLELELAIDGEDDQERRMARRSLLSREPVTWLSVERALRDAVTAGIANNAWKGVGDASALARQDDAARDAGLLGASTKPWYIASVKSRGYRAAHACFLLMVSMDVLLLPLELVFIRQTETMLWLQAARIAFDALYVVRIAGSFFVSFVNEKSVEVTDPHACRKAYLAGNCVMDMLAAFPLNLVLMTVGVTPMQFYASRLPRVLNARYCYRRYREWLASIDDEDLFSGMLSTMFIFLLTLHLLATVMDLFGYAEFVRDLTYETWAELYEIRRMEVNARRLDSRQAETIVLDHYLVSYFQTVSLVTTVGGMPPSNIAEFALQIFIMLVSMTVYAVIVGNLSSLVMKQDDEIIAKRAQLELVQGYVRHIRVPKELKQRLTRFFQQRFKSTSLSAVPADVIYRGLPMEVQIEVSKHTNRAVIEAARILRGCSAGFVDRLSSLLQERTPEAESVIFRTAEACKELIFVASGVIELYDDHQPGEEASITETRSFGETLGDVPFVFQVRHVHNARAAPDVETRMFVLLSAGYVDLLKTFPGMHDIVMENAIHQHEGAR
ncbi:hypothetical protein KFE25_012280 [Diacronema lutheri]|uniref:Cyclic nucleotide-binding domain-containing protein n=2 Tax=Diacronema lutheri TaxID=2081491 RepID=A0A8J6C7X8_DIALT|nr:hypothetical protein KFE25_012280 [Diacronema lutheri]